jgi:ribosomal protein S18 acetylase RimI-like enzyme
MINGVTIHKMVNPSEYESREVSTFLNSGYFDCEIEDFIDSQMYYVMKFDGEIVAARKILTGFNKYFNKTKWFDRLKDHVDPSRDAMYLHAIAVKKEFRSKGLGQLLLEESLQDIPNNIQVYSSLCSSNTMMKKYICSYGFSVIKRIPGRVVIAKGLNNVVSI